MSKNKIQVPEAKQAMEQFKMEAANEVVLRRETK